MIFAVILASMAACGKEAASSGTTKTTEEAGDHAAVTETGTEIETEEVPVFTEKDYGGKDFTMYLWSESQIAVEEE